MFSGRGRTRFARSANWWCRSRRPRRRAPAPRLWLRAWLAVAARLTGLAQRRGWARATRPVPLPAERVIAREQARWVRRRRARGNLGRPNPSLPPGLTPRTRPRPPRAGTLLHEPWHTAPREAHSGPRAQPRHGRGDHGEGDPIHPPPRLRHASPAGRRRRAPRPEPSRPCEAQDDGDLHPRRARGPPSRRREGPSTGEDLEAPTVRLGHRDGHRCGRALASPGPDLAAVRAAHVLSLS